MKDWFRDNLRFATSLIGSFDDRDDQYNLTLETSDQDANDKAYTLSYTEKTKGWVSFKSFIQQAGISHKNIYYTFPSNKYNSIPSNDPWGVAYEGTNTAEAHQHSLDIILKRLVSQPATNATIIIVNDGLGSIITGMNIEGDGIPTDTRVLSVACDGINCNVELDLALNGSVFINMNTELTFTTARNRFYGVDSYSMVKVMFNGAQGTVKRFKTLNYEGSQAKTSFDVDPTSVFKIDGTTIGQDYYDNHPKLGWYVHGISTDLQEGKMLEFIDKENKWFNYIRGNEDALQGDFLDTAEFSLQGLGLSSSNIGPVYGCTDSSAGNLYNPLANIDDGSCFVGDVGCMDATAYNYCVTCIVSDNDSCFPFIYGCITIYQDLSIPFNYNDYSGDGIGQDLTFDPDTDINTEDGSCYPVITGCTDAAMFNYQPDVGDPQVDINTPTNGICIAVALGCMDSQADNYDVNANTDNGSCLYTGCTDAIAINYDPLATTDDGSCIYDTVGCTNSTAANFNPDATGAGYSQVNGQWMGCIYEFPGCNDSVFPACNHGIYNDGTGLVDIDMYPIVVNNSGGDITINSILYQIGSNIPVEIIDDGSCDYSCSGCTDATACNYDASMAIDDGSCTYPAGCDDPLYIEYDASVTCPDNANDCDTLIVLGCTDSNADNGSYDITATVQDNPSSCEYNGCMDDDYYNYNSNATNDCVGALGGSDVGCCTNFVYGCTDPTQLNYDENANDDDGSCIPFMLGCMDATAINYNPTVNTDDGSCLYLPGCTDPTATNYNSNADIDDGTCILPSVDGCTDSLYLEYDPTATIDDGTCSTLIVLGCTDLTATNYDAAATSDDGSCITGCTDPTAPCNISVANNGGGEGVFTWDQDAGCGVGNMKSIIHISTVYDFSGFNPNLTGGNGQLSPFTANNIPANHLNVPIYVRAKCKGNNVWTVAPATYTIT